MSEQVLARRTGVSIFFNGKDITKEIAPYLLSVTYTDDTDDMADDLKIELQDRDNVWTENWLVDAVEAAAGDRLSISAVFTPKNWKQNNTLSTGVFELDSVNASGPPSIVEINAASLAFSRDMRQTKKSKAWELYALAGIAFEIAAGGGMKMVYEANANPFYERVEQTKQSDISFLKKLCEDAGISIKASDGNLILYDQAKYEARDPVLTIRKGEKGGYTKYKLSSGSAETQYATCRVSYMDPATGRCISGTAADGSVSGEQCLEITAKVGSVGEAIALAQKSLRLHNKMAKTATFEMLGDPGLVAGVTVQIEGWGGWDGKYIVTRATHKDGGGGYTTQIDARKVLNY